MIIKNGLIKHDTTRDAFWQNSYFEDNDGNIITKVIVCASEEFISTELRKSIIGIDVDKEIEEWFKEKINHIAETQANPEDVIIDVYPRVGGMFQAAKSFLNE